LGKGQNTDIAWQKASFIENGQKDAAVIFVLIIVEFHFASFFVQVQGRLKYSADGCALRLEKIHFVPKFELDTEVGRKGAFCKGLSSH
jgi:hypothetical protein